MTWNSNAKDYHCKCCGKQKLRMERKSQTCDGCFECNTVSTVTGRVSIS